MSWSLRYLVHLIRPPPPPAGFYVPPLSEVVATKLVGAVMWFWIMYKFRAEGRDYLGLSDKFGPLKDLDFNHDFIPLGRPEFMDDHPENPRNKLATALREYRQQLQ